MVPSRRGILRKLDAGPLFPRPGCTSGNEINDAGNQIHNVGQHNGHPAKGIVAGKSVFTVQLHISLPWFSGTLSSQPPQSENFEVFTWVWPRESWQILSCLVWSFQFSGYPILIISWQPGIVVTRSRSVLYFHLCCRPSSNDCTDYWLLHSQSCQPLWTKCIMRGSIWASNLDLANKLDVSTKDFTTQISRCARCHQWHVALSLFATLPSRRLRSNVVTSTAAMAGGEGWRRAMELLQKMLVDEIRVNSIAFNAVPGRLRTLFVGIASTSDKWWSKTSSQVLNPQDFSALVDLLWTCTGNPSWCLPSNLACTCIFFSRRTKSKTLHWRSRLVVAATPKMNRSNTFHKDVHVAGIIH